MAFEQHFEAAAVAGKGQTVDAGAPLTIALRGFGTAAEQQPQELRMTGDEMQRRLAGLIARFERSAAVEQGVGAKKMAAATSEVQRGIASGIAIRYGEAGFKEERQEAVSAEQGSMVQELPTIAIASGEPRATGQQRSQTGFIAVAQHYQGGTQIPFRALADAGAGGE
jgi:uncharacterized protein YukE